MIVARYGGDYNLALYLGIESPIDGMWFDWKTGLFVAKPTAEIQPFNQDPYLPGRYYIDFSGNQPNQFPNGRELMFWVMSNTGLLTPARQVVQAYATQMVSNPPWALHIYGFYMNIHEPGA